MSCLVEETIFEQVFQYGLVFFVFVVGQVGVFFSQHPHSQQERPSVGDIETDDITVDVGLFQRDVIHY